MYNERVDIWSTGCIFAEMLQGKPIFAGKDHVEQFFAITELLGTPDEEILAKTTSPQVSLYAILDIALQRALSGH
jgi:p38 MAP kinase